MSVIIDGVEYVKASEVKETTFVIDDKSPLPALQIGKFVIVRSYNEGINAGTVVAADNNSIILKNCRRLWRHWPKDKKLSWYEGVAISGLDDKSEVSCTSSLKVIVEKYSITAVTDKAKRSIMEKKPHEQ
jgi:hypothetical protein